MAFIAQDETRNREQKGVSFPSFPAGEKEIIRVTTPLTLAVVPGISKSRGIFESVAYARADIKTGHEAPWRRGNVN